MVTPLGPVQAEPQRRSPTGRDQRDVDTRPPKPGDARVGRHDPVSRDGDPVDPGEVVVDADAELAGDVVVTQAGRPQRLRGTTELERRDRRRRLAWTERSPAWRISRATRFSPTRIPWPSFSSLNTLGDP